MVIRSPPLRPPPDEAARSDAESLVRLQVYLNRVMSGFRNRWRTDYLRELNNFSVKSSQTRSIQVGEVVLIENQNAKRQLWPMGIVTEVREGQGNHVRMAVIRTGPNSFINRPVQRLYPLEVRLPSDFALLPRVAPAPVQAEAAAPDTTPDPQELEPPPPPIVDGPRGEYVGNPEGTARTRRGRRIRRPARFRD